MKIDHTEISGVVIVTPHRFEDARGWFAESWNSRSFADSGLAVDWVQDNHSCSISEGTLRGLHYQKPPHAQAKLVRCTRGAIWDVAVDFRPASPSYLKYVGIELTEDNMRQLFVPEGFLHGFVTLAPHAEVQYKCSTLYAPQSDAGIRWDDPEIGIDWPLQGTPLLSEKDASAPLVSETRNPFQA